MLILSGCCTYVYVFLSRRQHSIPFRDHANPRGCVPVSAYYRQPPPPFSRATLPPLGQERAHRRALTGPRVRARARAHITRVLEYTIRAASAPPPFGAAFMEDQLSRLIITSYELIPFLANWLQARSDASDSPISRLETALAPPRERSGGVQKIGILIQSCPRDVSSIHTELHFC